MAGSVVGHRGHYRGRIRTGAKSIPASVEAMSADRISRRVGAITESATLAVDARAKALQAAGEPVIGFGAGEPDFPTPDHIVEAAVAACRDPRNHHYSPAGGLPELKEAIAAKTLRDSGLEVLPGQVLVTNGGKHAVYNTFESLLNPGDEVLLPGALLDHLPRAGGPGGRRVGGRAHRRGQRVPGHRRPARGGPHACHQGPHLRVALQPDRRRLPGGGGARHRRVGRRPRHLGDHRRDLRAPRSTATTSSRRCRPWSPSWPTGAWCSTAWPRPTP